MKKNRTMRVAVLMLALTLVTCCFVGSTFAKYTSTASGSDSINVAKWSITVTDDGGAKELAATSAPTVVFDLGKLVTDAANKGTGDDDTNTVNNLLAPGTAGKFNLKVKNTAEVDANITVSFTAVSNNNDSITIPVVYSKDGGETWVENIAELNYAKDHAVGAAEETIEIIWMWAIDGSAEDAHSAQTNENDTKLGILAQTANVPNITITATVSATQND